MRFWVPCPGEVLLGVPHAQVWFYGQGERQGMSDAGGCLQPVSWSGRGCCHLQTVFYFGVVELGKYWLWKQMIGVEFSHRHR